MESMWIFVFGLMGFGALLFLCYSVFILYSYPYEYLKLNHESNDSNIFYRYLMLFAPALALFFGLYQIAYFLLGWMPEDWGRLGEDGYVTFRSSLATGFSSITGFFLLVSIHKGISAQVCLSEIDFGNYLNKRINYSLKPDLENLKEALNTALTGGKRKVFTIDNKLYYAIDTSKLPKEILDEIYLDSIKKIDKKLSE